MNTLFRSGLCLMAALAFCFSNDVFALGEDGVSIEGGATVVGQRLSKQNADIDKPVTGSADLVLDVDFGAFTMHSYFEASTTPDIGPSSLVAGINADAGTALTASGRGRIQLSELSIETDVGALNANIGVMDLTVFADATSTSNDEGSQFLADSLVNNPTIAFPDYTPALVFNYGNVDALQWTLMAANAYGLGDNASANYRGLFNFGKNDAGLDKGLFVLAEVRAPGERHEMLTSLGGWYRSSELDRLDGLGTQRHSFGFYANVDGVLNDTAWSARLGWNDGRSDITDGVDIFASGSIEHPFGNSALGIGVAYQRVFNDFRNTAVAPDVFANPLLVEAYYRWQINDWFAITPDVQYWHNPNGLSASSPGNIAANVWVYSLRAQFGFSHQMAHQ
ncbi:MAG: carbohydrate porin [Mariprofundaceae bacterium]